MTMIANVLSGYVGRPVVDRTELAGSFDFELTFDPASSAKAPVVPQPAPTLLSALQDGRSRAIADDWSRRTA